MSYVEQNWATGDIITSAKLNHIEEGLGDINVSYDKTTWQTGDVITAEKLNHMEDGIEAGGSSDFTTCKVTLTAGANGIFSDYLVFIDADEGMLVGPGVTTEEHSKVFDAVLYKGEAINAIFSDGDGNYYESDDLTVTGNITWTASDTATITGDCTITVK